MRGTPQSHRPSPLCAVHPRACGNARRAVRRSGAARFIPAPAGNALIAASLPWVCCGSSPRLRGTHWRASAAGTCRFIPAPAGNAASSPLEPITVPVHPRLYRERIFYTTPSLNGYDDVKSDSSPRRSSPRLRGTHGLISAARRRSVHPRACGERRWEECASGIHFGSSPRLRGTQGLLRPHDYQTGSSPRLRGTQVERHDQVPLPGSSPRLRGTRRRAVRAAETLRFIPAPAGNAAACSNGPASCGGSSPRLRGTPS